MVKQEEKKKGEIHPAFLLSHPVEWCLLAAASWPDLVLSEHRRQAADQWRCVLRERWAKHVTHHAFPISYSASKRHT